MHVWKGVALACSMVALALSLAGCSPHATSHMPAGQGATWTLVVIGDSSLWGLCRAFAEQIEEDVGVTVECEDRTVGGLSAGAVLDSLEGRETDSFKLRTLPDVLRRADVVVMFTNPEDSMAPEPLADLVGCFGFKPTPACEPPAWDSYVADLEAIWAEILKLRGDQPTILRATDLYNPLVSRWQERGMFEACDVSWTHMSDAAKEAAEAHSVPFLSRYDAFNGADHSEDPREKGLVHSDGEHPSLLMCELTADLLSEMGYDPVPVR